MANLSHRRTHNLLLISKLLNQRDHTSPFTLVFDSLEQPAKPLLREYLRRAKLGKSSSIFLAFETLKKPQACDNFITCWDKTPAQISQAVLQTWAATSGDRRCLIVIDSVSTLANLATKRSGDFNLTAFLSSILQSAHPDKTQSQKASLVAVCHSDVPPSVTLPYTPNPTELMSYLATTIIRLHSIQTLLAQKEARERSVVAPSFGLEQGAEGVVIGLVPSAKRLQPGDQGSVLELEHRRKSGRGVHEWYVLPEPAARRPAGTTTQGFREVVILLDDHPLFQSIPSEAVPSSEDLPETTFELGLTDRQRQERNGVVLPYFDAQKADSQGGGGDGGRILYDMGVEDDFDDEEDEI
jgi:elongator complex protein 5